VPTGAVDDHEISDDELAALALAADVDSPIEPDARPFVVEDAPPGLLPGWYMPPAVARATGRARRVVIAGIVGALVLVNAAGLCVTFGFPEIAW
jgi:hypothetical protein